MHHGREYKCICSGEEVQYNKTFPKDNIGLIIPIIYWAISNNSNTDTFKEVYKKAISEYLNNEQIQAKTLVELLKTFKETIIDKLPDEIKFYDEDMSLDIPRLAYQRNMLEKNEILKDLQKNLYILQSQKRKEMFLNIQDIKMLIY